MYVVLDLRYNTTMQTVRVFFENEYKHFSRLGSNAQKLITSISLYNIISVIFGIFLNAFLWRQSHNVIIVALFNAVTYGGIPAGFYANGWLIKKISPSVLYTLGLLIKGLSTLFLMFLPQVTIITIILYGVLSGIASGMYWANRNLLTLQNTKSENRIYFSGLEQTTGNISDIIIPFFIGWFITIGGTISLYSPVQGYRIVAVCMLFIIFILGLVMKSLTSNPISSSQITLKSASRSWNQMRLLQFFLGFLGGGWSFIPILMVLSLVGKENILGTIQSLSTIFVVIVTYILGKSLAVKHRLKLILTSFILSLFGACFFGVLYSTIGVIVFFVCQSLLVPLLWLATNSLTYDLIDKEDENPKNHYAYIFDQEIYLNGGRILAIIIFILLALTLSNNFALRFSSILFAMSQLGLFFLAKSLENLNHAHKPKVKSVPQNLSVIS